MLPYDCFCYLLPVLQVLNSKVELTHDRGEAERKAQRERHLTGHAAPVLRLSKEDDGAEEGHHQGEEQREAQQSIIGFDQRSSYLERKHHLHGRFPEDHKRK